MLDTSLYVGDNSDIPSELLKQFYHTFHQQVGVDFSCSCGTASILQAFYNISKLEFHFLLGSLLSDHKVIKSHQRVSSLLNNITSMQSTLDKWWDKYYYSGYCANSENKNLNCNSQLQSWMNTHCHLSVIDYLVY